ncbi:MAG: hypothetical protein JNL74_03385 [Fibrobacteres bacterium]|nr:hypothetical protein [Fibrobacterota bacterium]
MPILYMVLLGFSALGLSKGYKESEMMMNKVREESEEAGFNWVLISLGIAWLAIILLTVYARIKLELSLQLAVGVATLKMPALVMGLRFFEGDKYSKTLFVTDKVDQLANIALAGFAMYVYGSRMLAN